MPEFISILRYIRDVLYPDIVKKHNIVQDVKLNEDSINNVSDNMQSVITVANNEAQIQEISNQIFPVLDEILQADTNAGIATDKASEAEIHAERALTASDMSYKWANNPEDVIVHDGKYSAFHWAMKASDIVGDGVINDSSESLATTYSSSKLAILFAEPMSYIDGLQAELKSKVDDYAKGIANGVATLDLNAKVPLSQIPDSVLGQLEYKGVWNFTSMPTATQKGQYWVCNVAGNGYAIGDWAVYNGTTFDKVDNTDAVSSVAGRTGNIVLTKDDVGATSNNTSNAIVSRDASGNFSAGTITANLNGTASNADALDGRDSSEYVIQDVQGFIFLNHYIEPLSGNTDVSDKINEALAAYKVVIVPAGLSKEYYINSQINIPNGHTLVALSRDISQDSQTKFRIGPNGKIAVNANVTIENICFRRYDSVNGYSVPANMNGTAITSVTRGNPISNVKIKNCGIYGFGIGINVYNGGDSANNTRGNWIIDECKFDNIIDIRLGYIKDTMYISNCHKWPFLGNPVVPTEVSPIARGIFIEGYNEFMDWVLVTNCFSHSTRKFQSGQCNGKIIGGGYDCEDYSSTGNVDTALNIGIAPYFGTATRGTLDVIGFKFNGGQIQVMSYFFNDNNSISQVNLVGCSHHGFSQYAVFANDTNTSTQGGGVINITGMITGLNSIPTIPTHIFGLKGYAKINVNGMTRCPTQLDFLNRIDNTTKFQSSGIINL